MDTYASIIEPAGPRALSARPHTLFILPERRERGLTILILADGNNRSSPGEGYASGARRVVSIAEHLARREDVANMVACILSPENIAKRGDGFFRALYEEFIDLGVDIGTRGALVASGVRLEITGDLGPMRARGGHAAALADAVEAVVGMTACVRDPALRLTLGVGYGRDSVRDLGVDIVLRTGMEEPGVLRLSGLQTGERVAALAVTTLWPDIEPREVDELIDLAKRRRGPQLAKGHDLRVIVDLVNALSRATLAAPLRATITTEAAPAAVSEALERLYAGPLRGAASIAVEHAAHRWGAASRHVLRIVHGVPDIEGEVISVLAPGQRAPLFTLPDWLPLGHANVFACEATALGMLEGIRAAERFTRAHPPLRGADRELVRRVPDLVRTRRGAPDRDDIGDRFAAKTLEWAASRGLLLPDVAWRRAAVNYALTAFFIHFRIPAACDETGAGWEQRADLTAKYMLLVAAGDEAIFDRALDGETPEQRWARLEASARYLRSALDGEAQPPRVPGAELLATIAAEWRDIADRYGRSCPPRAAASFRAGLESLYDASLAEHRAGIRMSGPEDVAAVPPVIAARVRALRDNPPAGAHELRALLHLAEVSGAIGAGLLFRTAALAAPAASVTSTSVDVLDAAATLLDYHVRLSNDVSGFLDAPGGDRDPKENVCTILVPEAATGAARAAAVIQALATCRRLASWLGAEVGAHVDRVAAAWPWMGLILRRGAFVGRRVYEVGHYTTVSRAEMSAIFDEAESALG